jgi:diguanylate cyclase (GGDEF)-like protein/PAS domain S-box-containing protein
LIASLDGGSFQKGTRLCCPESGRRTIAHEVAHGGSQRAGGLAFAGCHKVTQDRHRLERFTQLPLAARLLVACAVLTASVLMLVFAEWPTDDRLPMFLVLLGSAFVASRFKLRLPTSKHRATLSVSFVVDFISLLSFGAHATTFVAAAGALSQSLFGGKRTNPPHRTLFNIACFVITIEASGWVYRAFGGTTVHLDWPFAIEPLAAATVAYFLVNSGLVALAISASTRQAVGQVWQHGFLWSGPNYFIGAAAAVTCVELTDRGLWLFLPLTALPIYMTYRAYTAYAGRLEYEHRHREIIESLNEGMAVIDHEGRVTLWNDAIERIIGRARGDVIGQPLVGVIDGIADDRLVQLVRAAMATGQPQAVNDLVLVRPDARRVVQVRLFPYAAGITLFWNDVTERVEAQEAFRHAALHDSLTDLPNRAFFVELVERALVQVGSEPGHRCAVLFIDVDRFKTINDSLGHHAGDELLKSVSRRLASCVRDGDSLARLGGDEFTILLNGLHGAEEAVAIAERIQVAIQAPFVVDGREVSTSASIGIALNRPDHRRSNDIMRDADIAMYRAKSAGKARHELFDADMQAEFVDKLAFELDLRRAVEREELWLSYQPIVSLESGQMVALETLVRWNRGGAAVPPSEFIPVAEELGLIEPLGIWVLKQACGQFAEWRRRHPHSSVTHLTVNVSTKQLVQPDFTTIVKTVVHDARMEPGALHLEITETALMRDPDLVVSVLNELRSFGVRIYLDDFGTGFSSLSHLHRLPVDALKLDRSFVTSLMQEGRPAIVESILALAQTLGTPVIAEGVETEDQLRELSRLGCASAQGHLFSTPLAAGAAEAVFGDQTALSLPKKRATVDHVVGQRRQQPTSVAAPPHSRLVH